MLFQEVLAIVIPVGGAHGGVNVLAGCSATATQRDGALVIKFDEHDRAVNAIIEDRLFIHLSNPCKASAIEVFCDFLHLHLGVAFLKISDPEASEL